MAVDKGSGTGGKKKGGKKKLSILPTPAPPVPKKRINDWRQRRRDDEDDMLREQMERQQQQIIAERDDSFDSLAERAGVDKSEFVRANKDISRVVPGAAYSVPQIDVSGGVGTGAGIALEMPSLRGGGPYDDQGLLANLTAYARGEITYEQMYENMRPAPGEPGSPEWWTQNPVGKYFWELVNPNNQSSLGVGLGAGIGLNRGSEPAPPPPQLGSTYADFRRAEAEAAYRDLEAERMKGTYDVTDIRDIPGYYGFYGTQEDIGRNPYFVPSETQMLPGAELDTGEFPRGETPELTNKEALERMWEDVYLDPENKGRGGGIVGWIEERTGLTIDPETFFTEGASDDVLQAILNSFRQDEINYLASHGILVEEEYDLPAGLGYGGYGGRYVYPSPSYYGGGEGKGRRPGRRGTGDNRIGLVSWSNI